MKVEVAVLGFPSLIVLMDSVDVKQHLKKLRTQELCESRDGRPGLTVPNSLHDLCGRKATLNLNDEEESISSGREVDIIAPLVAWLSHWPRHAELWPARSDLLFATSTAGSVGKKVKVPVSEGADQNEHLGWWCRR